jgi:hypothetical protein
LAQKVHVAMMHKSINICCVAELLDSCAICVYVCLCAAMHIPFKNIKVRVFFFSVALLLLLIQREKIKTLKDKKYINNNRKITREVVFTL